MPEQPEILARGPWRPEQVETTWRTDTWEPSDDLERRADEEIAKLRLVVDVAHEVWG